MSYQRTTRRTTRRTTPGGRRRLFVASLLAAACLAHFGSAHALSYWGKQSLGQLETALEKIERTIDRSIFDGTTVKADAGAAKQYLFKLQPLVGQAIDIFNKMSVPDRNDPEVRPLKAKLIEYQNYRNALSTALLGSPQQREEGEKLCKEFFVQVIQKLFQETGIPRPQGTNRDAMRTLLALTKEHFPETRGNDPEENWKGRAYDHVEDLTKDRTLIEKAVPYCSQPRYQDVGKYCDSYKANYSDHFKNPLLWCTAARNYKLLFQKGIERKIQLIGEHYSSHVMGADGLRAKEGWIGNEGAVTLKQLTTFPDEQKNKILDELKEYYDAAGLTFLRDLSIFKPIDDAYAAFAKAITELAPTLKTPAGSGGNPSIGLARQVITGWHSRARIKRAFMVDKSWQLEKGIKDRGGSVQAKPVRRMSGYILYQLPGEELCQLRSFDLRQYFTGSWQKTEPYMHFVRFQSCDQ